MSLRSSASVRRKNKTLEALHQSKATVKDISEFDENDFLSDDVHHELPF